jgi:cell wall-associated NlpC family hydrolase
MTVSAVAVSVAATGAPAFGDDYPSWNDVQEAKKNEATKKAEIDKIIELVEGLQKAADGANRESLIAAEAYLVTQEALNDASSRVDTLTRQAEEAEKKAETSRMRAGLMAAHLAKSGGELSGKLMINGDKADDLLYQLGAMSKLTKQSSAIYETAITEKNAAESIGQEAEAAKTERETLMVDAQVKFESAQSAAAVSRGALETQQNKSVELVAQLANLKDSTVEAERAYLTGLLAERQPVSPPGDSGDGQGGNAPSDGNNGNPGEREDVVPGPPAPNPDPVSPPNHGVVETAIAFALDQVGDRYVLGGAGPDAWDCSGLTRKAYSLAGVYIGNHSATHQYNSMNVMYQDMGDSSA